jgi:hypothetical protein
VLIGESSNDPVVHFLDAARPPTLPVKHPAQLAYVRLGRLQHDVPVGLDDEHDSVAGLEPEALADLFGDRDLALAGHRRRCHLLSFLLNPFLTR